MPFARPTLAELIDEQRAAFDARLAGADSRLRRSILDVLARSIAGAAWLMYGFLAFVSRQVFPDTAETSNLERWGSLFSVQRLPGTFAAGNVDFTGTDGKTILAGTELQRADGTRYTTDADATITSGTATAAVTALQSGTNGNAVAGVTLTFLAPVPGVDSTATVASGDLTGGADREGDDDYRARVIDRLRQAPQGGAAHDYVVWAKLVDGVTDVFIHPHQNGAGTVGIAPLFYDRANPIPLAADITAVDAAVAARKPALASLFVYALTAVPVNFTLSITPDTSAIRAAIQAELEDLFRREATPGGIILISHIREAISVAAGEVDHVLTSPSADIDLAGNKLQISTVGTFTWS